MSATLDVLCEAWGRIADPAHWTRRAYARDRWSRVVGWDDPRACRWCAVGAVGSVLGDRPTPGYPALQAATTQLFGTRSVNEINDEIGHAAIERIYALAVAYAADGVEP